MLKVEPRGYESKFWRYASPILALLLTGVTSGLIFAGMGRPAGLTVYTFLIAPLLQQDGLQALVVKAAPLIMMGVGRSPIVRMSGISVRTVSSRSERFAVAAWRWRFRTRHPGRSFRR
jgi:simple sugar transport system permease protein